MVSVIPRSKNAGRPTQKKRFIILFDMDDVERFTRDAGGIRLTEFALLKDRKPIGIFATDSTVNIYHTSEGEDAARGFISHLDFEYPGGDVDYEEFINANINSRMGAIVLTCDASEDARIAGTPGCPLRFSKADSQDSKDGHKQTINLASSVRGDRMGRIPLALIPATDNDEVNAILGLPAAPAAASGKNSTATAK
jgi:hypothetical protein